MQIKQRLIDYYRAPSGKVPVRDWLSSLKDKVTQAILYKRIRQAGLGQFDILDGMEGARIMKRKAQIVGFEDDLMEKLRDPEFASAYIMSAIVDNDIDFLPIALGDVAKAHGISKLADKTGINRRTLYKVFDKNGHPSFDLVMQIMGSLGMELEVRPKKSKKSKAS